MTFREQWAKYADARGGEKFSAAQEKMLRVAFFAGGHEVMELLIRTLPTLRNAGDAERFIRDLCLEIDEGILIDAGLERFIKP